MLALMRQGVVGMRMGGESRDGLAPLLALVAVVGVVAAWVWWKWGGTGWPVGSFWWDELALSGAAHAIRLGMIPTVDFWSPFIFPLYVKMLTEDWVGHQLAYVLECLLLGAIIVALFALLAVRNRLPNSAYWVVGLLTLSVVAPFNIGSVAESQPGTVVSACSYNRFGGAIIALVVMLPVVRRDGRRDPALTVWLGLVFVLSMLLKVTVLQVTWGLVALWAILSRDRAWWRLLWSASGLALLCLLMLGPKFDWGRGYASALVALSEVRAHLLRVHASHYVDLIWGHRLELFAMVFAALLMIVRATLLHVRWVGGIVWYLAACGAICVYTLTNFGDSGLMPAIALLWALPFLVANGDPAVMEKKEKSVRIAELLRKLVLAVTLIGGAGYAFSIAYWTWQLDARHADGDYVSAQVDSPFLRQYVFEPKDWFARGNISFNGVSINYRNPAVYASYLLGVDQGLQHLTDSDVSKQKSVYALDFPAYVFSLAGGYKVPRNTYPWLLYGHEITLDHHPDADLLFSDVDVLMVPKCSLAGGNRVMLKAVYRVPIERLFEKVASLQCWDVHHKRSGLNR